MADIVFGFGSSHGPLLSTPPEQWDLRADADRKNPAHAYRGGTYSLGELLALRQDGGFAPGQPLRVDGLLHLVGMVGAGKSTLRDILNRGPMDPLVAWRYLREIGDGLLPRYARSEAPDELDLPQKRIGGIRHQH